MSKSTEKYGKPIFTARLTAEATIEPSKKLLRQWEKLDKAAIAQFDKKYDSLSEKQKSDLHVQLAVAKDKARKERERKDSETEMRLEKELRDVS